MNTATDPNYWFWKSNISTIISWLLSIMDKAIGKLRCSCQLQKMSGMMSKPHILIFRTLLKFFESQIMIVACQTKLQRADHFL